jgi:signal transduction histidine kinase
VTVRLIESDGRLELTVADDGEGFDPQEPGSGFGLKTMAERVQALNGTFGVLSGPGSGTTIRVLAPLGTE